MSSCTRFVQRNSTFVGFYESLQTAAASSQSLVSLILDAVIESQITGLSASQFVSHNIVLTFRVSDENLFTSFVLEV